ncbi:MAG: S9 family peptidase [Pseudomonadales bacterium]|nr:S9 family peptidase [Pseudomonadales bacterium]
MFDIKTMFFDVKILRFTVLFIFLPLELMAAREIPIEDFVRHLDYLNINISPDGTHYAARMRNKGRVVGIVVNRATGKATTSVQGTLGDEITSLRWINNDRLIYTFAEKSAFYDSPSSYGELFAINKDGSKNEMIFGFRADDKKLGTKINKRRKNSYSSHEVISRLKNDPKNILILEHPWEKTLTGWWDTRNKKTIVVRLNTVTGRKYIIENLPHAGATAVADDEGNLLFTTWQDEEGDFQSAYRKNNDAPWQDIKSVFDLNGRVYPVGASQLLGKAWIYAEQGEKLLDNLYEVDFKSQNIRPIYDNLDTDLYRTTFANSVPIFGISYPKKFRYHYVDKNHTLSVAHRKLAKSFKGQEVSIVSSTNDHAEVVFRVTSDVNPGEYFIFDTKTNKADLLWVNQSWIDVAQMLPKQPIELEARDGMILHGYLTLPKKSEKAPLVVLPHGGPFGVRDYWRYESKVQLLASRGYGVLQINFRGSGGYGRTFVESGHRQWGGDLINDIVDATKWVVEQGYADKKNMCIYGASYGGYAALMSAIREPDLFQCAIGHVGVYDLEYLFTKGFYEKLNHSKSFFEKTVGNDLEFLRANSPVNHAEKIKAAIMLVHGSKDLIAPALHTKEMRKNLKKAGKKVKWLQFGKAGHGIRDEKDRAKFYKEVISFLDEHIGD